MKEELRYSRIEMLPEIGREGVEKLNRGSVLIIGCGALGSLSSMYLAASGVGTIGLCDFDTIDLSNLQRQLFFDEASLGKSKAGVLRQRMEALNPHTNVRVYNKMVNEPLASELFKEYDFIIDGSDNPSTKLMTDRVCAKLGKPYTIGGVKEFSGQVMSWAPGHKRYSEIFGEIPSCSGFTPCSLAGVLGPAAGVVASVQASEAIKYLTEAAPLLYDSLFLIDLKNNLSRTFKF